MMQSALREVVCRWIIGLPHSANELLRITAIPGRPRSPAASTVAGGGGR